MKETLRRKIEALQRGRLSAEEFLSFLRDLPFSNDSHVKIDFHRPLRRGLPEVIYGRGKSLEQCCAPLPPSSPRLKQPLLITRVEEGTFRKLKRDFPKLQYQARAKIIASGPPPKPAFIKKILVLSAGASDEPVAEEAYVSALYLGNPADREYDVGVACLPRVLSLQPRLNGYAAVIAVAGMEGALPSVVAGLTSTPVIAVPTSVGYGAHFGGVSALLSMLNSCAGGIGVVNIDNGFGAAFLATLINQKIAEK